MLAPRALIEAVLPSMRARGWGRIVNVGSSSTIEAIPHLALSNVHRMAAIGYFKTLAREVAGDGVTMNTVATGKIATDRIASMSGSMEAAREMAKRDVPAGRLGTPEEYGDLVAFLCSERAAYVTGTTIPIDGGLLRSTSSGRRSVVPDLAAGGEERVRLGDGFGLEGGDLLERSLVGDREAGPAALRRRRGRRSRARSRAGARRR